jgi:predicted HicB family RNase H-like nuclease
MSDFLEEYKGYVGSVHYSAEDEVFHGKLEGIRDLVTYEATDVSSLKQAFQEAVDDYLETCQKKKRTPATPFRGSFNVRVGPNLHKEAALYAAEHDQSLNSVVSKALEKYLEAAL